MLRTAGPFACLCGWGILSPLVLGLVDSACERRANGGEAILSHLLLGHAPASDGGDDADARRFVLGLAKQIGFDAVDAGPLINARSLETMGFFNIQLGYVLGHGTKMGLRLFHDEPAAPSKG